jgi:hypothetical protein
MVRNYRVAYLLLTIALGKLDHCAFSMFCFQDLEGARASLILDELPAVFVRQT